MKASKRQPPEIITNAVALGLLEASDNPAMILSRTGHILAANQAACVMLESGSPEETLGRLLTDFIARDLFIARRDRLRETLRTNGISRIEEDINGRTYIHTFTGIFNENDDMTQVAVISRDVTDLRRTGENLRREQQRQIFFMETLPGLVFHIYPDHTIRYANRYFRKIFGSPKGKSCRQLLQCSATLCPACPPERAMRSDSTVEQEWTLADSRTFHLQFNPMTDSSGERMVMVLGIDISERKNAENKLRQAHAELEQRVRERTQELQGLNRILTDKSLHLIEAKRRADSAARAKSAFLANMSHEIRTPLNAILGMAELALRTDEPSQKTVYLNHVVEAGDSLLTLINDILDFSKIEAGKMELEIEPFRLSEIIASVMRIHRVQAEDKDLEITDDIGADVPDVLLGDPQRLRQILINLMGNAVKFTTRGSVTLSVRREPMAQTAEDDSVLLRFSVRDTGVGIPKKQQKEIFNDFTQADASITRRFGGSGLGLAISKQLVQLMHGTIAVTSTEGRGSTFTFTVRLRTSRTEELVRTVTTREHPVQEVPHLSVLLADDNALNRKLAATVLREQGHDVTQVENGYEAVELLKAGRFDVVLMDVQMPIMDGITATRIIRDRNSGVLAPDIPIIALTAHALKGDRERFLSVGMNDYLSKPIRIQALSDTIARTMSRPDTMQPPTQQQRDETTKSAQEATPPFDRKTALERMNDREDLLESMERIFLRDTPPELAQLEKAVQSNDMEKGQHAAHSIKGNSRTIGAMRAGALAEQMEFLCSNSDTAEARRAMPLLAQEVRAAIDHVASMNPTATSETSHEQNDPHR
jgi:signal transduction histidine kinase/CheY-like chemotaxis protein